MNLFNALSQITRYGSQKGDNAVARMKHLNDIVNNLSAVYSVSPGDGDLVKNDNNSKLLTNLPIATNMYLATLKSNVTNLLETGKKINIAQVNTSAYAFKIESVKVTIGVNTQKYDGGDISLYLGDSLVAEIESSLLTVVKESDTAEFLLPLSPKVITLGTGKYTTGNSINVTYNNLLNIRSNAKTVLFDGIIGITVIESGIIVKNCPSNLCDK